MSDTPEDNKIAVCEALPLNSRVRAFLEQVARQRVPITYQALAKALQLSPPNTIHQLTIALECLMEEDAAVGHPFIAALVISKARGGLPAAGFFDCARRVAQYSGAEEGPDARAFHAAAFDAAVTFWGAAAEAKSD
ncbi:MAG: hypothetical protein O3B37_07475 [Proteobacteria bacterium]|nr:hypothetical protein [Pseudomonadota bacterium]